MPRKHQLKLIALLTSFILWAYVMSSARIKVEKTVAIDYKLPEGLVFLSRPPMEVIFTLEGPRAFIGPILDREEKIIVNLSSTVLPSHLRFKRQISASDLALPAGIRVEKISPRSLSLRLERIK